jgi:predicted SAM-dependent methyltransferase
LQALQQAQETSAASLAAQSERLQILQQVKKQADAVHEAQEALAASTAAQSERLQTLQQTQQRRCDELLAVLDEVRNREQSLRASCEASAATQEAQEKRLHQLATEQNGVFKWVDLISRKQQRLALDLREGQVRPVPASQDLPEPQVVNEKEYLDKIARMHGRVKVNLGCGEKPWPEYLNVDLYRLQDVDVVADARRLPFEPGSLAELASSHLVEHFREHQLRTGVLPYWKSLLQPDGVLRIICPNWAAMVRELTENRMSWSLFKLISFGAQDYAGDDHFAMYTPETLTALLKEAGFREVEVVALDRPNGECPEMELVVHP